MRTPEFKATHPWPVLPPDVLQVPPISGVGNVNESIGKFGGAGQLRNAANRLQSLLIAA